jgi:hypothetical protein
MLIEAFQLIRRNPGLFAVFFIMLCLPSVLSDVFKIASGQGAQAFILFYLLRSVQQMVLAGGSAKALNVKGGMSYSLKHFVFIGVTTAIALIPIFFFGLNAFALTLLIFCIAYPLILSILGTWPLSGVSLSWAFRCGISQFGRTYARLLLAFVVQFALASALVFLFAVPNLMVDGKFSASGTLAEIVAQAAQLVILTYIGVVLSRNYMSFTNLNNPPITTPGFIAQT